MNRPQKISSLYALVVLAVTALYTLTAYLQPAPRDGQTFWYWPVLIYAHSVIPMSIACGLVLMGVATFWIVALKTRAVNRGLLTAVFVLSLVTSGLMCGSSLPVLALNYRHIASATLDGRVYQLGVVFALDGDNYYVASACDSLGFVCQADYLVQAGRPNFTEIPQWAADPAAHTLALRVGAETVYTYRP
jgi:hypothetical protein